jgi:hypothetical protein
VQGGSTVKVSAANLTAGRDISTTGITVSSNTGDIELNWAAGSTHKVGSTFSTAYFTGMRVDADTRNTDIVSFDASGIGNVRIRTGVTETTQLNVDPTGNVTVSTGNLVVGTADKGIDFSANASAPGMTSELLNDYEEGTWTPNQGPGLTVVGAFSSSGTYTKIGRAVTVTGSVVGATSVAVGSAGIIVSNLPFTVSGNAQGAAGTGNVNQGAVVLAFSVQVYAMTAITAAASIDFTVTYFV